jgi:pimeloyl-ACP methyl ester carboxylesterase
VHPTGTPVAVGDVPANRAVWMRRVELPGRSSTRVWECEGPLGADTLMLIHGLTFTAELNWGRVLGRLGRRFHVVAFDQRGHGHGISAGSRFRLEDCADDGAGRQPRHTAPHRRGLLHGRHGRSTGTHPSLITGLVLCATARAMRETAADNLVALALPTLAAATRWHPATHELGAGLVGAVLLGHLDDAANGRRPRGLCKKADLFASVLTAACGPPARWRRPSVRKQRHRQSLTAAKKPGPGDGR